MNIQHKCTNEYETRKWQSHIQTRIRERELSKLQFAKCERTLSIERVTNAPKSANAYIIYTKCDVTYRERVIRDGLRNGKQWRVTSGIGRKQYIAYARANAHSHTFKVVHIARTFNDVLPFVTTHNARTLRDISAYIRVFGATHNERDNDANVHNANDDLFANELREYERQNELLSRGVMNDKHFLATRDERLTNDEIYLRNQMLKHNEYKSERVCMINGIANVERDGTLTKKRAW